MLNIKESDLINAIKQCKEEMSQRGIIFNKQLINTLYCLLNNYYILDKKYVILQAPTGSGKSIIGMCLSYCNGIISKLYCSENIQSYYLTSTKALQEQFNRDKKRFNLDDNFLHILKGTDNYICSYQVNYNKEINDHTINPTYKNRTCAGIPPQNIAVGRNGERFIECDKTCEYKIERYKSSSSQCSILNYHYFLTVLNSNNPYFDVRFLTICDEAHEISKIINDMYSYDINMAHLNKCTKYLPEDIANDVEKIRETLFKYDFTNSHDDPKKLNEFVEYFSFYADTLEKIILILLNKVKTSTPPLKNKVFELAESLKNNLNSVKHILNLCTERTNDLYMESVFVRDGLYKHLIKDLDETSILNQYFLSRINKTLFMSATIDTEEFVELYGLQEKDYTILKLPDSFNYEKSPIYMLNSGWLNFKNFDSNINNVLIDVLSIVHYEHPNDKGIIHTHTNNIKEMLMTLLLGYPLEFRLRFLFYSDSKEKEAKLKLQAEDPRPLILVGPSLTTGLDLKDDLARFNLLIKTPYPPLSDYVKRKMARYPSYYNAATKEEIIQTIGRTKRSIDDYSITYLLDGCFSKLIFNINDTITGRIKKFKVKQKYIPETQQMSNNTLTSDENKVWDNIFDDFTDDLPF